MNCTKVVNGLLGTGANKQAIWIFRNFFINTFDAKAEAICILCSSDSHYSMNKAANLLSLAILNVAVEVDTRSINITNVEKAELAAQSKRKKYFVVNCNMMTTMFGSVDDIDTYTHVLKASSADFKILVDGAYSGFYYPFTNEDSRLTFANEHITSFTLDAHKMAQVPYGTGVFLIRKDYMKHVNTQQTSYLEGEDYTLIGSRSGANASAIWMILCKNGTHGWHEKNSILQRRTEWMCKQLTQLNIVYYRHPMSNIITIQSQYLTKEIATRFGIVHDNHAAPQRSKIVIMNHVTIEKLNLLVDDLKVVNVLSEVNNI